MGDAGARLGERHLAGVCRVALSPKASATSQGHGMDGTCTFPWSYDDAMASFTLDGTTYEYLRQDPGPHENIKSSEYGKYPKVMATLPLADGATVDVYALASRWNPSHILVAWQDDEYRPHSAWVPAGNVRRVNDSEWDIEQYRRCPEHLRAIRWGARLPGFLPT